MKPMDKSWSEAKNKRSYTITLKRGIKSSFGHELTAQDEWLTEVLTGGVDATQDGDTLTLTDVDLEIVLEAQ